ncbi:hypothetical protein CVT24_001889 [Panaeolus cyanescens]|uniref:Uncharacterized protein n=1 Tax=Panaeolus cyanescens TaxID=181874 RepID=A0A409YER9_9AGAR|nr:hypothetical protein CVT24_001889 [Panaeolus cyanescens]
MSNSADNLSGYTQEYSPPARQDLESWVNTPGFDETCDRKAMERALAFSDQGDSLDDVDDPLWSSFDSNTSAADTDSHEVSKLEAYYYYYGLGPKGSHPRLIQRDSVDIFEVPTGPYTYIRQMRLLDVPGHCEFARNGLWDETRNWIETFLIGKDIKVSSIDFVMFTWLEELADRELESEDKGEDAEDMRAEGWEESEEDIDAAFAALTAGKPAKPLAEDGKRVYSNPTIWIGVLPETLNGARAFELTAHIRAHLDGLNLTERVDIAFRESVARYLGTGPALYPPAATNDPLQAFIDNVSVVHSLPISGRKTTMQGTLGPFFQYGGELYALTCRHNLFTSDDGNTEYWYNGSAPKRQVVVMGKPAFDSYVDSVQAHISALNKTAKTLKALIKTLTERVQQQINLPTSQHRLEENEAELVKINRRIVEFKQFYITLSRKWSKLSDRVIGHIVWAPPIAAGVGPNRVTQDLCVVRLYKPKFLAFMGNVLSLGPEISPQDFKRLMCEHINAPSEFEYPPHGLLHMTGTLTANDISSLDSRSQGDPSCIHRVIKRGFTTNTTVGTLSRFTSFVRKYTITGTLDSLELAILPHENATGAFSKGGDSGAMCVSATGAYVGKVSGGTSKGMDGSDITYATLFEYDWQRVLEEFPGASLYWDNIPAFLDAMAD